MHLSYIITSIQKKIEVVNFSQNCPLSMLKMETVICRIGRSPIFSFIFLPFRFYDETAMSFKFRILWVHTYNSPRQSAKYPLSMQSKCALGSELLVRIF